MTVSESTTKLTAEQKEVIKKKVIQQLAKAEDPATGKEKVITRQGSELFLVSKGTSLENCFYRFAYNYPEDLASIMAVCMLSGWQVRIKTMSSMHISHEELGKSFKIVLCPESGKITALGWKDNRYIIKNTFSWSKLVTQYI